MPINLSINTSPVIRKEKNTHPYVNSSFINDKIQNISVLSFINDKIQNISISSFINDKIQNIPVLSFINDKNAVSLSHL